MADPEHEGNEFAVNGPALPLTDTVPFGRVDAGVDRPMRTAREHGSESSIPARVVRYTHSIARTDQLTTPWGRWFSIEGLPTQP